MGVCIWDLGGLFIYLFIYYFFGEGGWGALIVRILQYFGLFCNTYTKWILVKVLFTDVSTFLLLGWGNTENNPRVLE